MEKSIDDLLEERGWRKVATGTWLYDQSVPMPVSIWAKPAHQASHATTMTISWTKAGLSPRPRTDTYTVAGPIAAETT
jgi:hypothetical protein